MHLIDIPTAPSIPGLTFRHYQGEQDLPAMLETLLASRLADQEDAYETLEEITNNYRHLNNCDPYQDVLIAEVNSQMVAYGRVTWWQVEPSGERIYFMLSFIHPDWRGQGLESTFLQCQQDRLQGIIRQQDHEAPFNGQRFFEAHATTFQPDQARLLEADGFQPVRYGSKMVCPDLQKVPDIQMPPGLEVRLARLEHNRPVWDAMIEAFQDHWGFVPPTENDYEAWLQSVEHQPDLWQVAWEGDEVAGMVLNYVTHNAQTAAEPRTAWTENICVRRPWRKRGLARALLARSMRMFRDRGFTKTFLGVDMDNPNGARGLYESMGYQLVYIHTMYRKPVKM